MDVLNKISSFLDDHIQFVTVSTPILMLTIAINSFVMKFLQTLYIYMSN